jgi:toxin HigB-1
MALLLDGDSEFRVRGDRTDFPGGIVPSLPAGHSARCPAEAAGIARGDGIAAQAVPPGNRLEALKGGRKGQHSVRVNDQWRICFRWREGNAYEVEIVDYH